MSKGLLYCPERNVDCMQMYIGNGICNLENCVRDDQEYLAEQAAREQRRNELLEKERRRRQEEEEAATKIRRQTKTLSLQEEIERKKRKMERLYTRGMTRAADKLSAEIGQLERRKKA